MFVVNRDSSMLKILARCVLFSFALLPTIAHAEPIQLKLAFFSSDSAILYHGGIKPFVDAVNSDGKGILEIEVFFRGTLGKAPALQAQMVRDGFCVTSTAGPHGAAQLYWR
jgi:TRAP-type transport system periplasmic protein